MRKARGKLSGRKRGVSAIGPRPLSPKRTLADPVNALPLLAFTTVCVPRGPWGTELDEGLSSVALGCMSLWPAPAVRVASAPAPAPASPGAVPPDLCSAATPPPHTSGLQPHSSALQPAPCPPGPAVLDPERTVSSQLQGPGFQQVLLVHSTATALPSSEKGLHPLQLAGTFWALAGAELP